MPKTPNHTVSQICSHECLNACYKEKCPRGEWHRPIFGGIASLSQVGTDIECPMLQFKAVQEPETTVPLTDRLSVNDTLQVCKKCKFATVTGNDIELDREHCYDCPCFQLREAIEEYEAEARSS